MISFELTPEQIGLQRKLHSLARKKLQPYSLQLDGKDPGPIDGGLLKIIAEENCIRPSLMDKFHRDAQTLRIVEGTSQIQKMIIASQV
ncbi:hypothetical protein SY88_18735 [Clostridiales bacterium PH28_bin88]|nr:hypothetical protein SY88_18735 [Clostridiales bacterium PH28_bin88]